MVARKNLKRKKTVKKLAIADESIKKPNQQVSYTAWQLDELRKCAEDIFYFIENYVQVIHPAKGSDLFKPYPYQREIIKGFLENRNSVVMAGRQLGKTTCAGAYLLWQAIFNSDQTILIVSNVFSAAGEVMERLRYSYEMLPNWLKPGVKTYNKNSITFDNASRVMARATTKNSARGLSISVLYCDELSAVDLKKQAEFWSAIRPTLSTGGKCIVTSTPGNDEDVFGQIWAAATDIYDEHGNENPKGLGRNGFKALKFIWSDHPDRDEVWEKEERSNMDDEKFAREHECEFISGDETLINQFTLSSLVARDPLYKSGNVKWYARPMPNHSYLVALDPSMGTGRDYAAIQVFQLPQMIQIGEWQHNKTDIPTQVKILREITLELQDAINKGFNRTGNEIYWTVENNSIGEAANIVIKEIGEDKFAGSYLSQPVKAGSTVRRKGYTMTNKMKLEACSRFKSLMEKKKITINSKPLVSQLKNFVARGASYAAKGSENDDLVMATLLIVKMLERVMKYEEELLENFQESVDGGDHRQPLGFV